MLFNSLEFLYLFLPVVLGLFYLASRLRLVKVSKHVLLWSSVFFYGYWNIFYFFILAFKIITNYFMALFLEKKRSKQLLYFSIFFNLGILIYFKYLNFFIDAINSVVPVIPVTVAVTIPLGISFYTFTQLAYLEDLYDRKTRFYGLMQYTLFVVFFPHLIAGPIIHYAQIMPQFDRVRTYLIKYRNFFTGIFFFIVGLFQKAVIADSLSPMADAGFANAGYLSCLEAWGAVLTYTMQIYFDFAGYSNMAIGLGLLFNIRFPVNFNSPYQATSIIDFWRRWHMTLSQFLRDYLYIRLGGNRLGEWRKYMNIFLTMLIGGLWHGAGWTFILWGAYHGILIVLNHVMEKMGYKPSHFLAKTATFLLVVYGWVFFRSPHWETALAMTKSMAGFHGLGLHETPYIAKKQLLFLFIPMLIAFFMPNAEYWAKKIRPNLRWGIVFGLMFMAGILCLNRESAFLYFQF